MQHTEREWQEANQIKITKWFRLDKLTCAIKEWTSALISKQKRFSIVRAHHRPRVRGKWGNESCTIYTKRTQKQYHVILFGRCDGRTIRASFLHSLRSHSLARSIARHRRRRRRRCSILTPIALFFRCCSSSSFILAPVYLHNTE